MTTTYSFDRYLAVEDDYLNDQLADWLDEALDELWENVEDVDEFLTVNQLGRAVERNQYWATQLGWQGHYDAITSLLASSGCLQAEYTPSWNKLAEAVACWQLKQRGLTSDGIIGPNTWQRMQTALGMASSSDSLISSRRTSQIKRVWAFATRVLIPAQRDQWLNRIASLRITDVVLVVNDVESQTFGLSRSTRSISEVAANLRALGVDVHLMTWLYPFEGYIADSARVMLPLCELTQARSILFDVERNWIQPKQQIDHQKIVHSHFDRFYGSASCPLGVTSVTFLPPAVRALAEHPNCQYVLPQAYSNDRGYLERLRILRPGKSDRIYQPRETQKTAHSKWKKLGKPIVMGLASYCLNRPNNISQQQAMDRAIQTVTQLTNPSIQEVAYWS